MAILFANISFYHFLYRTASGQGKVQTDKNYYTFYFFNSPFPDKSTHLKIKLSLGVIRMPKKKAGKKVCILYAFPDPSPSFHVLHLRFT